MNGGEIKICSHSRDWGYPLNILGECPFLVHAPLAPKFSPPPTPPPKGDIGNFRFAKIGSRRRFFSFCATLLLFFPMLMYGQSLPIAQQADSQYELSQYDSALVDFNQVVVQYPAKKEGYYNRGLCYYHLNRLAEAQKDFTTCLQIDSVFDDARFMKILTLQQQGDWGASFTEFKKFNTNYTGYNELKKRIRYHNLSVSVSRNWYYMIAIMFLFIIFIGVLAKGYAVRKGA